MDDNEVPTPDGLAFEVGERHLLSERRRTRDRLTVLHNSRREGHRRRSRCGGGGNGRRTRSRCATGPSSCSARSARSRSTWSSSTRASYVGSSPTSGCATVIDAAHASDIAVVALGGRGRGDGHARGSASASTSGRASTSPVPRARADRRVARGGMNRLRPRWVAWPHGRPGGVRRTRDAVHVRAVLGSAAHDAQPVRRRGPRAGDLPARLPRVRRVQGGHQPQGLALQDPHEHLHQLLPGEEAPARPGRPRRQRGLLPVPPPRRARGGGGRPHPRDRGARQHPRRDR